MRMMQLRAGFREFASTAPGSLRRWLWLSLWRVAGCGGGGDQASKMTSFSTTESAASKAELFSLPADQMAHIQIYTVAQAPLVRTLRLSGAVAYNAFQTTPVITQVGGPVNRIMVTPGRASDGGPADALRHQPRLFAAALGLPQSA